MIKIVSPDVRDLLDYFVGNPSAVDDYTAARTPSPPDGGPNHHSTHPPDRAPLITNKQQATPERGESP